MYDFGLENINTLRLCYQNQTHIGRAARLLSHGKIVAVPTETVYGLAANAFNPQAIKNVFAAKKRPLANPVIAHVGSEQDAKKLFAWYELSAKAHHRYQVLAQNFWPGPLTIIAKRSREISPLICANSNKVAIRIPSHPIFHQLIEMINQPLIMPSANISSRPSPTSAAHVLSTLDGRIDAVLDGGPCQYGIESTVVIIDEPTVVMPRAGSVSQQQIEEVLQEKILSQAPNKVVSPGTHFKHYCPKVIDIKMIDAKELEPKWPKPCTIIGRNDDLKGLINSDRWKNRKGLILSLSNDPQGFAKEIYDAFYQAELMPEQPLLIVKPPFCGGDWHAVWDRLVRACNLSGDTSPQI